MTATIDLQELGKNAKKAFRTFSHSTTEERNRALKILSNNLLKEKATLLEANRKDLEVGKEAGLNEAMLDRLSLQGRLEGIVSDVQTVVSLPDPVGKILEKRTLPNGLSLTKVTTPIGVLGVIYEARPNVTVDVASIAIKTGNCAILRGGSETLRSNRELIKVIQKSLEEANLPKNVIQFIDSTDRIYVTELLKLDAFVDMIIPRGGAGLHQFCRENSHIPVITGGIGICHLFVDESADLDQSLEVIHNAKTQRPTVCNALDTLLVHESVAKKFLPMVIEKLSSSQVQFRLDPKAYALCPSQNSCQSAKEGDWDKEWLGLTLGIRVVTDLNEAVDHIQQHSSGHSDGILTQNEPHADRFVELIDSSSVYVNASTRFTDGAQFGLGAEVAISTQKLHARGPMGPDELMTYKWIVRGNYHVRK